MPSGRVSRPLRPWRHRTRRDEPERIECRLRLFPWRNRDKDARPSLVVAVRWVVAVLLVGTALEERNPGHEQQEQGDEERPGHHGESGSVESRDGVDEQPPPDE